ncbi:MAG: hypothetical protein BWX66_00783 [Deltaproteobacteria bacterium ADurb.Bin058]|nr:MAG: hypothetical protein BWX66_00783 [Deltaproteobacteria bacterium ADurb.Bin058]
MINPGYATEAITTSASISSDCRFSSDTPLQPNCSATAIALSTVLLATTTFCAPAAANVLATASAILPAPSNKTVHLAKSPNTLRARSTAIEPTETCPVPTPVEERTSFATLKARSKKRPSTGPTVPASEAILYALLVWPKIWGSPRTSESSEAATLKRCLIAAIPSKVYRWGTISFEFTPLAIASDSTILDLIS